jgi:hypothetical protein
MRLDQLNLMLEPQYGFLLPFGSQGLRYIVVTLGMSAGSAPSAGSQPDPARIKLQLCTESFWRNGGDVLLKCPEAAFLA